MPYKSLIMHNPDKHPAYMYNQTQKMPVGWCHHNKHRGKLSVKQMRKHQCLKKQCPFLAKNLKHSYWEEREYVRQSKRNKKFEARFSEILKEEIKKALEQI